MLVVADEPAIVGPTGLVFRALGYEIRVASNADAALLQLMEDIPEVVLIDAEVAGADVRDLTHDIRAIEGGERVVVIITGYGAEPAGNAADGFVSRPFDPIKVIELIDALGRA
jgi:DNA-binding response OmpR family regulator